MENLNNNELLALVNQSFGDNFTKAKEKISESQIDSNTIYTNLSVIERKRLAEQEKADREFFEFYDKFLFNKDSIDLLDERMGYFLNKCSSIVIKEFF